MKKNDIYLGNTRLFDSQASVTGDFIEIKKEKFYRIMNYNQMPDFFMTIVSYNDHWMFISSTGSLSAGRKNRDNALFPYYTDDKIHDYCGITGSKTIIIVEKAGKRFLWEPFSKELSKIYKLERNIYKSEYGDKIIFEEINYDLNVSFQYSWYSSEKFGFIKKSKITNLSVGSLKLMVLDGIQNILPSGVHYNFQNEYSNLLDGYKKNELIEQTGLGLYMLSSIPVDKAEPSESLIATTVWSEGLEDKNILISANQVQNFKKGLDVHTETSVRAVRGAYYVTSELTFGSNKNQEWIIVAEINQSSSDVANLNNFLKNKESFQEIINTDVQKGTTALVKIVAGADGLQSSNEKLCSARHFSNTLFNIMRGGVFLNNYIIDTNDFEEFVTLSNKKVSLELLYIFDKLPAEITNAELIKLAEENGNSDFIRLSYEYLPLTFSRRHGDPSRPWNIFSIENKNEDGSPKSDFQGNWRDIFQNWEALSLSYPEYIQNMISKFVNASTADGYNPYRIMRNGIDWESPDPDDQWAYIGYWGDHQIIYLQKLLELSDKYNPGNIDKFLSKEIFAYANVPYVIKSYDKILNNPQDTIEFDHKKNETIRAVVEENGSDGRLLSDHENRIYYVNLTEKILVSLLAKLSNFVPEAGIWMNTQRPEWNDANNALVGNGASMVTLYYLRRYLKFWNDKYNNISNTNITISEEVRTLFDSIFNLFTENLSILKTGFSDKTRRFFIDTLGKAGTEYRNIIYKKSFSGVRKAISIDALEKFTRTALAYIDQSIKVNKRNDGLYHAYNLLSFNNEGVSIRHLYEMLEGQVAVLSSGYLSPEESLDVLDSLKSSKLFRQHQYSYLLYPDRELPKFYEKNNIPGNRLKESKLLGLMITNNDSSIIKADNSGNYHFHASIRNANALDYALSALTADRYDETSKEEKAIILAIYEEMFDHKSFTGRSGTFYGYEGLGRYWFIQISRAIWRISDGCLFSYSREWGCKTTWVLPYVRFLLYTH
jgi:hypothetical protein